MPGGEVVRYVQVILNNESISYISVDINHKNHCVILYFDWLFNENERLEYIRLTLDF